MIRIFIENYRDTTDNVSEGISANGLQKYNIVKGTFRNHTAHFLNHYVLRLSTLKQQGNNNSKFYQITPFGILTYLKWTRTHESPKLDLDGDFFPKLFEHWASLIDIFGPDVFFKVVSRTLDKIDIIPELEGTIDDKPFYYGRLDESIMIPMGLVEVKIVRKYEKAKIQEIPTTKGWRKFKAYKTLNQEIDDKINERFTFLLLFNLLHLGTSTSAFVNFYAQDHLTYEKLEEQTLDDANQDIKKLEKTILENVDKLFALINSDKDLCSLMKTSISEITNLLSNRKSVEDIYNRLE